MKISSIDDLCKLPVIDIYNSIPTLTDLLGLDNVEDHSERVRLRSEVINKWPDREWWDYGEYIGRSGQHVKTSLKLSTEGNLIHINKNGNLVILTNASEYKDNIGDYKKIQHKRDIFSINRMVACTFIPVPDRLIDVPIKTLQANHKVREKKSDNSLSNLEWTTPSENTRHGRGNEDYIHSDHFLFDYEGIKFVIGRDEGRLSRNQMKAIVKSEGNGTPYRDAIITLITKEETSQYYQGFPPGVFEEMFSKKITRATGKKCYFGQVLQGEHNGYNFYITDKHMFNFEDGKVGTIHKVNGCILIRIRLADLPENHPVMTDEIFKTLT